MKIDINIPTSLSDITLRQYQRFEKECKDLENESKLTQKILDIFCGLNLKDSLKVKSVDAEAIKDIVLDMLSERPQRITSFNMNGIEYRIIPDLNDISLGEQIDLDENITSYETMHLAMAVLYRPIKQEVKGLYNVVDYEPLKYDMMDMPMSAVVYGTVFFYNLGMDLLKNTVDYLQEAEANSMAQVDLMQNGDGSLRYLLSLTEILQDLNISLN